MKKTVGFVSAVIVVLAGFLCAAYWMDRTSYVDTPNLPRPDPTAVGASLQTREVPRGEGPVLTGQTPERAQEEVKATPAPFFWMAVGALCAGVGVFVATRRRGRGKERYALPRDYR